ncbi:MAG: nucleotide exchange factor GrpE [Oscillospiraceae bacterium]
MSKKESTQEKNEEQEIKSTSDSAKQTETTNEPKTQKPPKSKETKISEVEKIILEKNDLNDKLLRQIAEFDNYKKRTAKEKDEILLYSKVLCVKQLLDVVDNFERALQVESTDAEFKKGVEMIFTQLSQSLKEIGVEEIEAMNMPFDPQFHNAVNQIEDENFAANTVCQVFQKGYKIGDKVVRHAVVIVANP